MSRFGLKTLLVKYGKLARNEAGLSVNIRLCNRYYSSPTNYWYYCKRTEIIPENFNDIVIYYCGHARHNELYHVNYDVNKVYSQITDYRYKIYNMGTKIVSRASSSEKYRLQINSLTPITIITRYGIKSVIKFRIGLYSGYKILIWREALHMPLYKYVDDEGTIAMASPFVMGECLTYADITDLISIMFETHDIRPISVTEFKWQPPQI